MEKLLEREDKAKYLVLSLIKEDNLELTLENLKVVWFCKTLKNWKAWIITDLPDQVMYEVTYNGQKEETYIDSYVKAYNMRITDNDYFEMIHGSGTHEND
jgi:hypothetical protein